MMKRPRKYIPRNAVESDAVDAIGYDESEKLLDIEFTGGEIYRYENVPPEEYRALMAADSIGGYVNRRISLDTGSASSTSADRPGR